MGRGSPRNPSPPPTWRSSKAGQEGIAKQHARGRLTIRERIDGVLDPGTFQEQGQATAIPDYDDNDKLLGFVPANYVVGFGRIEGRRGLSSAARTSP